MTRVSGTFKPPAEMSARYRMALPQIIEVTAGCLSKVRTNARERACAHPLIRFAPNREAPCTIGLGRCTNSTRLDIPRPQ
jgi:hypothetical protein